MDFSKKYCCEVFYTFIIFIDYLSVLTLKKKSNLSNKIVYGLYYKCYESYKNICNA